MKTPGLYFSAVLVSCSAFAGCSGGGEKDDRPPRTAVTGKVTLKGQPVDGAQVVLSPKDPNGAGAAGITDSNGEFALTTFTDKDGALPGSYTVSVSKYEKQTPAPVDEANYDPDAKGSPPAKNLLPAKYLNPTKSGLTAEIKANQPETLNLDLVE